MDFKVQKNFFWVLKSYGWGWGDMVAQACNSSVWEFELFGIHSKSLFQTTKQGRQDDSVGECLSPSLLIHI